MDRHLTPYEEKKLELELFYLKPGLNLAEKVDPSEVSRQLLRDELRSLKRSNEKLQQQVAFLASRNQELEDYAHTVAHNLKNPLSSMIITADAITEIHDLTPQEIQEFMQQIRSTAYEMNDTIDNLLLLSEVRKTDAPLEVVDMGPVVASIRKRLNYLLEEYQGTIIGPRTWHSALGYAPWLGEVWANYLSNAIKYGGRPPVIRVGSTQRPDGSISFWVLDNGFGIPAEAQAQLFTPFTQFSKTHRPGHGLGLSIVRHIVEKLGGTVGVESKAGKGSLFYFTLPPVEEAQGKLFEKKDRV